MMAGLSDCVVNASILFQCSLCVRVFCVIPFELLRLTFQCVFQILCDSRMKSVDQARSPLGPSGCPLGYIISFYVGREMASGGRFSLICAGSLQYVVDQLCGRILRVFGDKPAVEGGPFTLEKDEDPLRWMLQRKDDDEAYILTDILPWELKVDATGDEPFISKLLFRGRTVAGHLAFTSVSSFVLTVVCRGGKAFQAQWYQRLAVENHGNTPTRLTCTLKHFMRQMGWSPYAWRGNWQAGAAKRITNLLEYFGVRPDHLHDSHRSTSSLSKTPKFKKDDATSDEYYSITVVGMLLCICKFFHCGWDDRDDGHDEEKRRGWSELLQGLLMWPLRCTSIWGISIEGIDFVIEDGELDLKMLRTSFAKSFQSRRYRRYPFLSPHANFMAINWCQIHGVRVSRQLFTRRPEMFSIRREASLYPRMYYFLQHDCQLGDRLEW